MEQHVLIIDDDDDLRGAAARALDDEGIRVAQADSVSEGLKMLEALPELRVIVLDLHFPDNEDGSVLLNKLKKRADAYRIIVYTGYIDRLKADKAIDLHVYAYVPKGSGAVPAGDVGFSPERLSSMVEPLKFAINQAFKDLEAEGLRKLIGAHRQIQKVIHSPKKGIEALNLICDRLVNLIGGYTCHIRLLDLRKGDYQLAAYYGPEGVDELFKQNKRLNEPFSGEVAKSGKESFYQDIQADATFVNFKRRVLEDDESERFREYLDTIGAAYIVPIRTRLFDNPEQVDAVLNISGAQRDFFTTERIDMVGEFITDAGLAISKSWLEEKRAEIHDDYKTSSSLLVEVSAKLQQADLNQIFEIVLRRVAEIISPEMVSLFIYNERTGRVENRAEFVGKQIHYDREESYAPGESITGNVFLNKQPELINDRPTEHKFYATAREEVDTRRLPSQQIKHYMAVPLIAGDEAVGVIRAVNKKSSYYDKSYPAVTGDERCLLSRGFSQDCQVILGIIASHLAVTIKNSQLIGQLNERVEQLGALANVGQRISANYGLETKTKDLLAMIVEETAAVMNAAICMLFDKDSETGRLILKQSYGIDLPRGTSYGMNEDYFTPQVAATGVPVIQEKAEEYNGKFDADILRSLRERYGEEAKITSFMIAPIKIVQNDSTVREDQIIGVLKVINKKSGHLRFDEHDLSLFQTFASQISVARVIAERNRSLFRLVQGVGHEIENSVALIAPNAEISIKHLQKLIAERAAADGVSERLDIIKDMVDTIYAAAREAQDFTQDLLGFSDSRFRERKPFELKELITREVEKFRESPPPSVVNTAQVEVSFDFCDGDLLCEIYETPFVHVIRNIVANAYQAMEDKPGGRLTIKGRRATQKQGLEKEVTCIEVTDTGKGIEAADIGKIFRSDFSRRKGGNGLGLWLVRLSLLRMDGDIFVESEVGAGSTFKIELPIFHPKSEAATNE